MKSISSPSPTTISAILALGVLSISLAAPLFKLSAPTHPLVASAFRLTVAGGLWTIWILFHSRPSWKQSKVMLKIGCFGAFCYAVHFGSWVWSLSLTTTTASVTLVTTTPLMLGIVGWLTQKDAPHAGIWKGISWAFLGVLVLGLSQMNASNIGSLLGYTLALIGAMAMAIYLWLVRSVKEDLHLPLLSLCLTFGGGGLLWLSCWNLEVPIEIPTSQAFWALIGAACIPQMIGHTALTWSLKYATPTEVGLATVAEPVGASLCTWWILNEVPSLWEFCGSTFILFGVYAVLKKPLPIPSLKDESSSL